jgi:hypothetical protein
MILAAAGLMTACGASMASDRHGSDSMTTTSETANMAMIRRVYEECINEGKL